MQFCCHDNTISINDFRKKQKLEEATWDEQKAEVDHRERIRQRQEANRKKPVIWDDSKERKCQERYRKKYSSSDH